METVKKLHKRSLKAPLMRSILCCKTSSMLQKTTRLLRASSTSITGSSSTRVLRRRRRRRRSKNRSRGRKPRPRKRTRKISAPKRATRNQERRGSLRGTMKTTRIGGIGDERPRFAVRNQLTLLARFDPFVYHLSSSA